MSWFKKDKTNFNIDKHTFNYLFTSIFDNSFEELLKTCDSIRTFSSNIIIMFISDSVHICEFKNTKYLDRLLSHSLKNNDVSKGYSIVKNEYKKSLTLDNILDNINTIGFDHISKDELIFLIKNKK